MPDRKIVILGHTGFIGRALQVHFEREGREVVGFSSRAADLRRPDGLRPLDGVIDRRTVVIFASAITRDRGDTLGTLLDNVAMAGHLAAFLESHPPAQCVCLSSDAVYAAQEDPITEDTPVCPGGTFYAIAKYTAECLLRRSAEAASIPLLVLRPTAVFGPGDTHRAYGPNAFLRDVIDRREVRLFGQGEERRDHLYIGDLVRLVARLVQSEVVGTVNLATGVSRSFAEVVECLRRVVPFEFRVSHLPRRVPVTHRRFDIARLARQVPGFAFTSPEDALREAFECLRAATVSGDADGRAPGPTA